MMYSLPVLLVGSLLVWVVQISWASSPAKDNVMLILSSTMDEKGVSNKVQMDLIQMDVLPQMSMTVSIPWYKKSHTFSGPLFREVLKAAKMSGNKLYVVALNDSVSEIPLDDLNKYNVILSTRPDGKLLTVRDKGPLFVMYPFDKKPELQRKEIFECCIWQVNQIRIE